MTRRDGGQILVDQLISQGTKTVFCVPGESFLPAINAFFRRKKDIRLVVCRQEGGAAFMADAQGKLLGEPGVCFVTRGPGASNAVIGVHTAQQDSTPMILLIGQVGGDIIDREAFQEVDYNRMFGGLCKWVARVERTDRIPEYVKKAYQISTSGRPGPVVLVFPEDILSGESTVLNEKKYKRIKASASRADMVSFFSMLERSTRPLFLLGGSNWSVEACNNINRFVTLHNLPVACTFRRQDRFDNKHQCYAGEVGIGINSLLRKNLGHADLIIAIGPRLGEMTTGGYEIFRESKKQKLIHVHQGAEELGTFYSGDLMINSGMDEFCFELKQFKNFTPKKSWSNWTRKLNQNYTDTLIVNCEKSSFADMGVFMKVLKQMVPDDSIITNGAGNYTGWVQRYWQYETLGCQLAPTSGAMGYGVPSGIAASILNPEKFVISFSGDGCFLMNGQELATCMLYGARVLFIVINNGMYGTIRLHQERSYKIGKFGTELFNPSFVGLAKSYGLFSELITDNEQIEGAIDRALSAKVSGLLELIVDPNRITNRLTLSDFNN